MPFSIVARAHASSHQPLRREPGHLGRRQPRRQLSAALAAASLRLHLHRSGEPLPSVEHELGDLVCADEGGRHAQRLEADLVSPDAETTKRSLCKANLATGHPAFTNADDMPVCRALEERERMKGLEPTTFCMASEREWLRLVSPSRKQADSRPVAVVRVARVLGSWLTSC